MIARIGHILRSHTGLINYTLLNYIDKALSFGVPLIVLWVFSDKAIYNEIEYIYSIGLVVAVLIELGVRNYFLYAYRETQDRDLLSERVFSVFLLQFAIYSLLSILLFGIALSAGVVLSSTFLFIVVRALFMYFVSFFTIYFRIVDKPSTVFGFSIGTNLATVGIVLGSRYLFDEINMTMFFLSQLGLILLTLLGAWRYRNLISLRKSLPYLKAAFRFAWPITLNILIVLFLTNYGKIYARNYLPEGDMFYLSFVQRLTMLIQLTHISAVGYLTKRVFVENQTRIHLRIFAVYAGMMLLSVVGVLCMLVTVNWLHPEMQIGISVVSLLLVAYMTMWCFGSYGEQYINKMNRNKVIPAFSLASAGVFLAIQLVGSHTTLLSISLSMVAAIGCYMSLIFLYLGKHYTTNVEDSVLSPTRSTVPVR